MTFLFWLFGLAFPWRSLFTAWRFWLWCVLAPLPFISAATTFPAVWTTDQKLKSATLHGLFRLSKMATVLFCLSNRNSFVGERVGGKMVSLRRDEILGDLLEFNEFNSLKHTPKAWLIYDLKWISFVIYYNSVMILLKPCSFLHTLISSITLTALNYLQVPSNRI